MSVTLENPTVDDFKNLKSDITKLEIRNSKILILSSHLKNLENLSLIEYQIETEYFVGFEITDEEKGSIGRVLAVDQSTANALFVVETESGEVLIPVADEYITGIDHDIKIITVNLPEGLLDL